MSWWNVLIHGMNTPARIQSRAGVPGTGVVVGEEVRGGQVETQGVLKVQWNVQPFQALSGPATNFVYWGSAPNCVMAQLWSILVAFRWTVGQAPSVQVSENIDSPSFHYTHLSSPLIPPVHTLPGVLPSPHTQRDSSLQECSQKLYAVIWGSACHVQCYNKGLFWFSPRTSCHLSSSTCFPWRRRTAPG